MKKQAKPHGGGRKLLVPLVVAHVACCGGLLLLLLAGSATTGAAAGLLGNPHVQVGGVAVLLGSGLLMWRRLRGRTRRPEAEDTAIPFGSAPSPKST
ncbi:MAG: hypothetical protein V3S29_10595 [bacterium]